MNITMRQQEILVAVIQEYSKKGKPVASKDLLDNYNFSYSPATIRAEMYALEQTEFLHKPHTSAGRVPTDKGYRFYVRELMNQRFLQNSLKKTLEKRIQKITKEQIFACELANILADLSQSLVIVSEPKDHQFYFAGLTSLIPSLESEVLVDLLSFLEIAERDFDVFFEISEGKPKIFIGTDHPMLRTSHCGIIASRFKKDKEEGALALAGPSRMDYEKNLSLLRYIDQILD
jgi:transcriptional regulator of heat shock response